MDCGDCNSLSSDLSPQEEHVSIGDESILDLSFEVIKPDCLLIGIIVDLLGKSLNFLEQIVVFIFTTIVETIDKFSRILKDFLEIVVDLVDFLKDTLESLIQVNPSLVVLDEWLKLP